jgi:hypothetical protein
VLVAAGVAALIYVWVESEFVTLLRFSSRLSEATSSIVHDELTHELKTFSKTPAWLVATSLSVMLLAAALVKFN